MCIFNNCHNKNKYGEYCYKHRKNYLCNENIIIYERFTNKESDYLKKDIIQTIEEINYPNYKEVRSKKKDEIFNLLIKTFQTFQKYNEKDMQRIIQLQRNIKNKINNQLNQLRGEGFLNKSLSNNDTDFFTYETRDEIEDKYYFSYKDNKGFIWFFDIRSFNKLIELKQPNPYTMCEIPQEAIQRAKKLNKKLKLGVNDEIIDSKQIQVSRRQMIKQKTIDLFCEIDNAGYYCQPIWFLSLNLILLKKLYSNLEDLWNYRLQISNEVRSRICPPNGQVFTTRVSDVNRYTNRDELRNLLLNDIMKFQNAVSFEDKKLGYMYFIIGLGTVSRPCVETHEWLMYV